MPRNDFVGARRFWGETGEGPFLPAEPDWLAVSDCPDTERVPDVAGVTRGGLGVFVEVEDVEAFMERVLVLSVEGVPDRVSVDLRDCEGAGIREGGYWPDPAR